MSGIPADGDDLETRLDDADLETLRDAFVEAYNARDLEGILDLVSEDVETPELGNEGAVALAAEIQAYWDHWASAILTRATVDDAPAAVAWLPDETGRWVRTRLVTLDGEQGMLTLIELPDDPDALERAIAEDPLGDSLDDENDWSVWERGETSRDAGWGWDESLLREDTQRPTPPNQ